MKPSSCKSCSADIVWMKTDAGKNIPVDMASVEKGDEPIFDPKRHTSHFVTCPHAKIHRRK